MRHQELGLIAYCLPQGGGQKIYRSRQDFEVQLEGTPMKLRVISLTGVCATKGPIHDDQVVGGTALRNITVLKVTATS